MHLPAARKWKEPASKYTSGSRVPHFCHSQQRMHLALVPWPCQRQHFRQMDVLHILKQNPCAGTGLWCFREQFWTLSSISQKILFQIAISFPSEGSRRGGGVFKAAQISLLYDIPAWEFLKVRDLRLSLIFKAKPTRNGCLLDCLHTPTAGLAKIFLWWKNFHLFQNFCWPTFSRITPILNVFADWNTSSLLPPPVLPTKVFLKLSNWWFSEYLLGVKSV